MLLHEQGLDDIVVERLGLKAGKADLSRWEEVVDRLSHTRHEVNVALVGKYVDHADAYKSLTEAITHGGLRQRIKVNILGSKPNRLKQKVLPVSTAPMPSWCPAVLASAALKAR